MGGVADHPFVAVHAMAQAEGLTSLEHFSAYDGALHRLICQKPQIVFRLKSDPGSAIDRQTFDYFQHILLDPEPPARLLAVIRSHLAGSPAT